MAFEFEVQRHPATGAQEVPDAAHIKRRCTASKPSWRDVLPIHPAAEMFPLMAPDELRALGDDIIKNGLTSPIVLWSDGKFLLLDGRNRLDAIELATGSPVEIGPPSLMAGKDFLAADKVIVLNKSVDPHAFVISANIYRRHLNPEERAKILFEFIARTPEKSDRQIAKEIGVDHKTIGRARAQGEDVGRIPHVEMRTDSKGRKQPARKATTKSPPASEEGLQQRAASASVAPTDLTAAVGAWTGALARKDARIEELQAEKRRLEIENIGLRSEVEELKAKLAAAERSAETTDDGLAIPDYLDRRVAR